MPVGIPEFRDNRLFQLSACAIFDVDDMVRLSWFDEDIAAQAHYAPAEGDHGVWLRLNVDKLEEKKRGHLHVEVAPDCQFEEVSYLEKVSPEKVTEYLAHFAGQATVIDSLARFVVPFEDVPKRGIVSTLLGVSTQACGAEMNLTGAELSISDDTFNRVRWSLEDELLTARLSAETKCVIGDRYLIDLEALMIDGFECFVLEIASSKGKNAKSRSVAQENAVG